MEKINWTDFKSATSPILDAYRVIGANLQNAMEEKNVKALAFTSLTSSSEKSSVVAGIAIMLAQSGKKVLLIDGNFTEPAQHILFDIPNEGVLESLATNSDCFSMVQTCVEQPNLDILTCGKAQQSTDSVMISSTVQQFLLAAREQYDCILLEMPSLEKGADAIILSTKTDSVVLLVEKGEDTVNALTDAKARFEQAGVTVMGCVLLHALNANV